MKFNKCSGFKIQSFGTPSAFDPSNINESKFSECGSGECPDECKGPRGKSVENVENIDGNIIVTFDDGSTELPGSLPKGPPGEKGVDVTGIQTINGEVTVIFGDGSIESPGSLPKGERGPKGEQGQQGNKGTIGQEGEQGLLGFTRNCYPYFATIIDPPGQSQALFQTSTLTLNNVVDDYPVLTQNTNIKAFLENVNVGSIIQVTDPNNDDIYIDSVINTITVGSINTVIDIQTIIAVPVNGAPITVCINAAGQKGDLGPKGQPGDKGIAGVGGGQGTKGNPGVKGIKGESGPSGPKGEIGDAGEGGTSTVAVLSNNGSQQAVWSIGSTDGIPGKIVVDFNNTVVNESNLVNVVNGVITVTQPGFYYISVDLSYTHSSGSNVPSNQNLDVAMRLLKNTDVLKYAGCHINKYNEFFNGVNGPGNWHIYTDTMVNLVNGDELKVEVTNSGEANVAMGVGGAQENGNAGFELSDTGDNTSQLTIIKLRD